MSPREYLDEIVLPTVEDFLVDGSSRRKAYLACIVTFHLKDYLTRSQATDVEKTIRGHAEAAFAVVSAVAHGAKHSISGGREGQIKFQAGTDFCWFTNSIQTLPSGFSAFGDAEGGIMIAADDHYSASVVAAVRTLVRAFVMSFHDSHFAGFDLSRLDRLNFPAYFLTEQSDL